MILRKIKKGFFPRAYYQLITSKEISLMVVYMLLYLVLCFNIIPQDIIFSFIAIVVIMAPLKSALLMFLFFTLWENVTVFSFGITLNFFLQIIVFTKILINHIYFNNVLFYRFSDFLLLLGAFFYGIMDYLIGTKGISGIGVGINLFIALYSFSIYRNEKRSVVFWEAVFFTLMCSTIIATIYGLINNTSHDRWIRGMGYVKQLYGTVGTARMGMFFCSSLIYPVFYTKSKVIKIILSIMFSLGALMTLSITSLICLIFFWNVIILFKGGNSFRKNIKILFFISISLFIICLSWGRIREFRYIKPLAIRTASMVKALHAGDMRVATSTRSFLLKAYINDFKTYPLKNKVWGSFFINRFSIIKNNNVGVKNYAHNTFVDILLYSGILGIIFFNIIIFKRISFYKKRREFLPLLLLKGIFILTGLSVSMLTSSYWLIWIIL